MSCPSLVNDVLFKIVFGTANSEPVLKALLNALLGYTGEQRIASLTIANPTLEKEEGIGMAIETMRKAYARDEVRELIRMREKARRDYLSGLADARNEGLELGRAEGLEKGLEEGLEKGREKGLEEVARRMLERGADRALILEVTNLSEQDLAALEKE